MKCDLILKTFKGSDGSEKVYVELTTPKGITCPIKNVAKNDKLYYKLKCEINESAAIDGTKEKK